MASWTVCSTVAEPPELLCAFAAHYLDLGAEEVHLFLDAPDEETIDILSAMDGVRLTLCTDEYWREVGGSRPQGQVMRQLRNANLGYAECRSDWFFFCDADEFLAVSRDVGALLDGLPGTLPFCRPRMSERVFSEASPQQGLFDGRYRRMLLRPAAERRVYGELAPMVTRGLTGHVAGKSFVRTGQDLRIRIHFPVPLSEKEEALRKAGGDLVPGPYLDESWLVHFDGMTPLHWQLKLLRYYLSYAPQLKAEGRTGFLQRTPARSAQLMALYESSGDPAELARLLRLIRLTPEMVAELEQIDGFLDLSLDPTASARDRAGRNMTFSAANFDAVLRARHGELIREYGLLG
ncbi:glycosyltransferase family 2 protein [Sinirhodobacter huangdaonensis]|uniref:glycosyltransferase family 2 protein n=1 Tax=Paenirhodobacter huangdaonensis TaxID=2501515 RepID=UPI0013E3D6F3|nr:glycosyltransferase family 2 protein [Sinirhodobacter huangdaonensis]